LISVTPCVPIFGPASAAELATITASWPAGDGIRGKVLLFSAEMTRREINRRRLCAEARTPSSRFEAGALAPTERDWRAIADAKGRLSKRVFVVEASAPSPLEMRAKARYVKARLGLDLVLVDYLLIMNTGPGRKGETREAEVARVSRSLKRLALDLAVVLIAAAQVNRVPEGRRSAEPQLHDLRESGAIEQDADVVLMLHREADNSDEAEIHVRKHRNRGPGTAHVRFNGDIHRFEDGRGGNS
jgi:replicative DNA helicase